MKDINGINNDWQVQSVKDAEEKGWSFVCALENKGIIYKGDKSMAQPINDLKYEKNLRCISIIGNWGVIISVCGCIGFIFGFLSRINIF